jgi:chromosome segregation ATPase
MRDIRADIKERIAAVDAEKDRLEEEIDKLYNRLDMLQELLTEEETRLASEQVGPEPKPQPTESLDDFVVKLFRRRALSKDELAEALDKAGYVKAGQSPGRVSHGKLLGLISARIVQFNDELKKYELVKEVRRSENDGARPVNLLARQDHDEGVA